MDRPTILFYCQHLLGVGHLSRSLVFCEALLDRFNVVFLQGGPDIGRTIVSPHFEHVLLPPILMREHDSSLYDPTGTETLLTLWNRREQILDRILSRTFSAVVVELFPFGRNKFKPEILKIIAKARDMNPNVNVYCSNRDIMVQKVDQAHREEKIVRLLEDHFDYVLVHSDPVVISMDETFAATPQIAKMLKYTGYVASVSQNRFDGVFRERRILVSLGGGAVGDELAMACIEIARRFPLYEFRILTGPYTTDTARNALVAASAPVPNVDLRGFSNDFRAELSAVELSISLAGYNTLMDILATRTPALVYPYMANLEQSMRARALADRGFWGVIYEDMLAPEPLAAAIEDRLSAPYVEPEINISGAKIAAEIVASQIRPIV